MTHANKLLQDISAAISDKGAGDIDPQRLSNISLGELLSFLDRHGIQLTLGGQMDIQEMAMAIAEKTKPEGMKHIHGVVIEVIGCKGEEEEKDPLNISYEDMLKMNGEQAEAWLDSFPPGIFNHPVMVSKLRGLISMYELAAAVSGGSLPHIAVVEALKRRVG